MKKPQIKTISLLITLSLSVFAGTSQAALKETPLGRVRALSQTIVPNLDECIGNLEEIHFGMNVEGYTCDMKGFELKAGEIATYLETKHYSVKSLQCSVYLEATKDGYRITAKTTKNFLPWISKDEATQCILKGIPVSKAMGLVEDPNLGVSRIIFSPWENMINN